MPAQGGTSGAWWLVRRANGHEAPLQTPAHWAYSREPMKRYRMAVCKGPDCSRSGGPSVFEALRNALTARNLTSRCELYRGGCYGLCHLGPNVVVREVVEGQKRDPFSREDFELTGKAGEVHYAGMRKEHAERVVDEHVGEDRPVEEWTGVRRAR
ncbi:MAG: (2Fe-2S) ferredoxin domain-containing protein [Myxococcales bacterium]